MKRILMLMGLIACAALLVAGCGSDDSSSDTTSASQSADADAGGSATGGGEGKAGEGGSKGDDSGGGGSAGGGGSDSGNGGGGNAGLSESELAQKFEAPPGGDDSIQTFGDEVEGEQEDEIVTAMRAFFRALAAKDSAAVCDGLSSGNRQQIESFLKLKKEEGNCSTLVSTFLGRQGDEARRAANGTVYQVRVEDENAFVLFLPEGGQASYFVMKHEDDGWKSTSLAPGVPFNPIPSSPSQ